eukprot:g71519.t1
MSQVFDSYLVLASLCSLPTILPLSVCFCAKGTSPEWGMQPTLWGGSLADYNDSSLTDPIVPPGVGPPSDNQDKTRHPLHLILTSGDTKTAGLTDPTRVTPKQEMVRNVLSQCQELGSGLLVRPNRGDQTLSGTGTKTALHGLIREPTNTPEILSPTTKTPTQCFILSPTTKRLPRNGDCTITYSHAIPYANQTSRPYLAAPAARAVPHLSARHLTLQSSIYPDTKAAGKTPRSGIQLVGTKCKTYTGTPRDLSPEPHFGLVSAKSPF